MSRRQELGILAALSALTGALGAALLMLLPLLRAQGEAGMSSSQTVLAGNLVPAGASLAEARAPGAALLRAATPEEMREVILFCREAGGNDLASVRKMAFESDDPLVAGNAIKALGRLEKIRHGDELMALLEDPRPRVRHETIRALCAPGRYTSIAKLVELLETERDPTARVLAIQGLGRIGGRRAEKALREICDDPRTSETERLFARTR
jgi:hypothetical protein